MGSRMRTLGRLAAFGALAVLLTACLKLDMDIEVASDNTVSGTVIFGVQSELAELAGGQIEDLFTDAPLPSDVPGVSAEEYEDDEFVGQRFIFDAVPLDRFNSGEDPDQLRIERDGNVFRVSGALDLTTGEEATGPTGFDPSEFLEGAELRISITFPGEVTSSNGQIDGDTVTWVPEIGDRIELEATANATGGGGGTTTALLVAGAAAVILAVVIGVLMARRRRSSAVGPGAGPEAGPEEMPPTPPPVGPPPGGPPPPPPAV